MSELKQTAGLLGDCSQKLFQVVQKHCMTFRHSYRPPPPPPGDRHFHVFLVKMYCAGLCCPSALCMALHCFPITSNQAPVCVL